MKINKMLLQILRKLIFKAIPEFSNLDLSILISVKSAMEKEHTKTVKCDNLILIGSLVNSKVEIKPTIKPEIVLSKFTLESALNVSGTGHSLANCYFESFETAVRVNTTKEKK